MTIAHTTVDADTVTEHDDVSQNPTVNVTDYNGDLSVTPRAVTVGGPSGNVLAAVPGALTFTAGNWNTG